ncbi:MAG: nitronate monooxygenase [Actinomycetaceae bacterium]|nr:nitronate monooxygenase [Actinomycetaceae bacterium]
MAGPADTALPLIAAPMAGGPSTIELCAAVAAAGALPFLAGGYLDPSQLQTSIERLRERVSDFGVNLFVPGPEELDQDAFADYVNTLTPLARELGVSLDPDPRMDDDHYREKLDLVVAEAPAAVSFTFGLPEPRDVRRLHQAGSAVLITVTTVSEARAATLTGADALIVQGPRAGGHSATFNPARRIADVPTIDVVRAVSSVTHLPLIATGGVDGPGMVRELRGAGAAAVAVGTLLLLSDEAGTSPLIRSALTDPTFTRTALTTAFTGRPARSLINQFVRHCDANAPLGYPAIHHLTAPLRGHGFRSGNVEVVNLWAGTGYRSAWAGPAAEILEWLASEL